MKILVSTCLDGGCPTVYSTENDDELLIKGYTVQVDDCAQDEHVVRVPKAMILEAAAEMAVRA